MSLSSVLRFCICLLSLFLFRPALSTCTPPPEGLWQIRIHEPQILFSHPRFAGFIIFKKAAEIENLYLGNVTFHQQSVLDFFTQSFIHGIFDVDDCVLFGGFVFPRVRIFEIVRLRFDGEKHMFGLFIPFIMEIKAGIAGSLHFLEYIGPAPQSLNMTQLLHLL